MSIRLRLMLLLGGLLAVLLASLLILQWQERREAELLRDDARQNRVQMLNHWLDLTSRTLPQTAADLAQSEAVARLVTQPGPDDHEKILAEMNRVNVQLLCLLDDAGAILFRNSTDSGATPAPDLLPADDFKTLVSETHSPRFFAEQNEQLFEVCIRRLAGGAGHPWLLLAHRWDGEHLKNLSSLTESAVTLDPPANLAHEPVADGRNIVLLRPLNDWQGNPLRVLRLQYADPAAGSLIQTHTWQAWLFIVFGLLVLTALGLALQHWILRPLRQISDSLARDETTHIRTLSHQNNELGRVARLVKSSFAQREELRRTIEERARLGRDLHDGVIQSLYAAGMGLASVRTLLPTDPAEAGTRIEQTRSALNETIRDVRNFITGLEPEALKQQSFTHAIASLLEFMQSVRPTRTSVDIDEQVASRLSLSQRIHALQIAREAVSNAIRHGEARHVQVLLRALDATVRLEIVDDGKGFEPGSQKVSGHGLENFARRARELGGEFTVDSAPGLGTRIQLAFPLPL